MWRFLRKKKEVLVKEYASDLMAAMGKLPLQAEFIRYRITPGVTAEFDQWLLQAYQECQKREPQRLFEQLPVLNFVCAAMGEHSLPMLGTITASKDSSGRHYPFSLIRLLEHPLAHEFRSVIPWLYRETFSSMQQLSEQPAEEINLTELYKQIENMRFCNSRLKRRDALEAIIQQLRYMTFGHFWDACRLSCMPSVFIQHTTTLLREFRKGNYRGIRLPLPNHYDLMPTVVFWMQLLETTLGHQFQQWQVYWHGCYTHHKAAMVFYLDKLPASSLANIFDQQLSQAEIADTCVIPNTIVENAIHRDMARDTQGSMIKVLSRWGQLINS